MLALIFTETLSYSCYDILIGEILECIDTCWAETQEIIFIVRVNECAFF